MTLKNFLSFDVNPTKSDYTWELATSQGCYVDEFIADAQDEFHPL